LAANSLCKYSAHRQHFNLQAGIGATFRIGLAAALIKLSSDSRLRSQLAANVLAMHFGDESWFSIADRTKDFYCTILAHSV